MFSKTVCCAIALSLPFALGCSSADDVAVPEKDAGVAKDSAVVVVPDSGTTDATTLPDSSGPVDSGAEAEASVVDSGPAPVNGCKPGDFVAASAISWTFMVVPACVSIKAGSSVTWNGNFVTHPLAAFNGDMPSPIVTTTAGMTYTAKFQKAGVYGFHCLQHPAMLGAVRVMP